MSNKLCPVCQEPAASNDDGVCKYCDDIVLGAIMDLAAGRSYPPGRHRASPRFPYTKDDWFLHPVVVKRLNEVGRAPKIKVTNSDFPTLDGKEHPITHTKQTAPKAIIIGLKGHHYFCNYPRHQNEGKIQTIPPFAANTQTTQASSPNCKCGYCGGPAFQLLFSIECLNKCRG
ncbi:MAG: hypothetical protein ACXABY_33330 [Candidatus Thorarchaeota archaeon]|jgi:hypothetical protein